MKIKISVLCLLLIAVSFLSLYFLNKDNGLNLIFDCNKKNNFELYIGREITVMGKAENALEGAVVTGEHAFIYIGNFSKWPDDQHYKNILVTGKLTVKVWPPRDSGDIPEARPTGKHYYLTADKVIFQN
jgi:hypothetical protein